MQLSDTLNMDTGRPVPNTRLEEAEIFLQSRANEIRDWKLQCKLQDAQGAGGDEKGHTCNFAWMPWFPYAKKNRKKWNAICLVPPCITARIDRFFFSEVYFETKKIEPFNEMNMDERRSCCMFREAANLSDHFQVALDVTSNARLLKGTTQAFDNTSV